MEKYEETNQSQHLLVDDAIKGAIDFKILKSHDENKDSKYTLNESVKKALEVIQSDVDNINDIDELKEYHNKLADEIEDYNKLLGDFVELLDKSKSNIITKEELGEYLKTPIKEIKLKCAKYSLIEFVENDYILTDDEIGKLKAVFLGALEIIRRRNIIEHK